MAAAVSVVPFHSTMKINPPRESLKLRSTTKETRGQLVSQCHHKSDIAEQYL